jgi:hypothetical protein
MSDAPNQGLPGDGGDGGEEPEEPTEPEGGEPGAQVPALATDPILTNAIDVPGLGGPVDASAAEAISSAQAAATEAAPPS